MAKKVLDINPVFNHRNSVGLLDTAEALVDSLDNLSVCLKHIEEKYVEEDKPDVKAKAKAGVKTKQDSLFTKLKENLEKARDLTDTLKREKWRLSRREMSVELRMGELEEYKVNLKRDMTDMNQTVDCLSMRIVQLENALCEAQEVQEGTDAERKQLDGDLKESKKTIDGLEAKLKKANGDIQSLKSKKTDSVLRREHDEISNKIEVLLIENHRLKEMIREKEDELDRCSVTSVSSTGEYRVGGSAAAAAKKDSNADSISLGSVTSSEGTPGTPVFTRTTEIEYV